MPYPSRIDAASVIDTAQSLIESSGVESLSLGRIASELGVTAPSLYRYYPNKTALLRAVNVQTVNRLFEAVDPALTMDADVQTRLYEAAAQYRAFALENASLYGLMFTNTIDDVRPDEADVEAQVIPFQNLVAEFVGDEHSLDALRGFQALLHGFVMLEIAEQFRRGGDLNAAFDLSVQAFLNGWR